MAHAKLARWLIVDDDIQHAAGLIETRWNDDRCLFSNRSQGRQLECADVAFVIARTVQGRTYANAARYARQVGDAAYERARVVLHQPGNLGEQEMFSIMRSDDHQLTMLDALPCGKSRQTKAAGRMIDDLPFIDRKGCLGLDNQLLPWLSPLAKREQRVELTTGVGSRRVRLDEFFAGNAKMHRFKTHGNVCTTLRRETPESAGRGDLPPWAGQMFKQADYVGRCLFTQAELRGGD